ncbi:hypothetical protein D1872_261940 [compost metagenome]
MLINSSLTRIGLLSTLGLQCEASGRGYLFYLCFNQLIQNPVQYFFSLVPERGMPKVMCDGSTFYHLRVNDQSCVICLFQLYFRMAAQQASGCFTRNLRYLQRMRQSCAIIIARACTKYL